MTDVPLPAPSEAQTLVTDDCEWSVAGSLPDAFEPQVSVAEDTVSCDSDDSQSSTDSDAESCATEVLEEQASSQPPAPVFGGELKFYQHKKSKVVHTASLLGTSFTCGRQLTPEYRKCTEMMVVESMKCQQCQKRTSTRTRDDDLVDMDAAVKRARR